MIKELWYGNVAPFEQCTRGDKQLKELLKLVARNKEELDASLTDKQKETLEKFEENMNEMHGIAERDAFSYTKTTVTSHIKDKHISAVLISGKYIVPKSALVDFIVSDPAFEIVNKSPWHMNTILLFAEE